MSFAEWTLKRGWIKSASIYFLNTVNLEVIASISYCHGWRMVKNMILLIKISWKSAYKYMYLISECMVLLLPESPSCIFYKNLSINSEVYFLLMHCRWLLAFEVVRFEIKYIMLLYFMHFRQYTGHYLKHYLKYWKGMILKDSSK